MENEQIEVDLNEPQDEPTAVAQEQPPWGQFAEVLERLASAPQAQPAQQQQAQPQLSPERIKELNQELARQLYAEPVQVISAISNEIAERRVREMQAQLQPYESEIIEGFVERFRSRKREDDPLYKHIVSAFDESLEDHEVRALASRPRSEQTKILNRYWNAAKGEILGKRVKPPEPVVAVNNSAGGGRGAASAPSGGGKLSDQERAMLYRSMSKENAEKAIQEIEATL
jgi:hypothetical protein